jgi:hypothetical protein
MSNEPGFKSLGNVIPKYAVINGSGTTTIVAAVSGKRISVIAFLVTGTATATMTFKSATTALTGPMNLGIAAGMGGSDTVSPLTGSWNPDGHFQTTAGEALKITASTGTAAGYLSYIEV